MWKRTLLLVLCLLCLVSVAGAEPPYHRIVVLADPHLPYSTERHTDPQKQDQVLAAKVKVRDDLNAWRDVALVAVVGDLTAETGTKEEYQTAKTYFDGLSQPLAPVNGNHDFRYADERNPAGKLVRGDSKNRLLKLQRFRDAFGLASLSYTRQLGAYLLVFLSNEMEEDSPLLLQFSGKQLQWLRSTLENHRNRPTLVFTHSPLRDTLTNYNRYANTPNFYAQPAAELQEILAENPQVFLWVSGHTHTPPTNPDFHSDINWYAGHVLNLHVPDMDRETIWSRSLYLYPDHVVVKTFNHRTGGWLNELELSVPLPGEGT